MTANAEFTGVRGAKKIPETLKNTQSLNTERNPEKMRPASPVQSLVGQFYATSRYSLTSTMW